MGINNEEEVKNLLKSAYKPVVPPPELKERLREQLAIEASGTGASISPSLWEQPRFMVPILAALVSGLIGYGAWLSMNVVQILVP